MDNSNVDSKPTNEPQSRDALLSLDAEVKERLEDCYAEVKFLEGTSAAIQDCLQQDSHSSPSNAGNVAHDESDYNQHYYEEEFDSGGADEDCYDDYQEEQFEDEEGEYEDRDNNDEYRN